MPGALLDTPVKCCEFVSHRQFFCHQMVIYLLLKLIIEDWVWNVMITELLERLRWTEATHNPWARNWAGGPPLGLSADPVSPSWLLTDRLSAYSVKRNRVAGSKRPPERFQCAALEKMKGGRTLKTTEEIAVCCQDFIHKEVILGALYTLVKGNKESVN